MYADAEIEQLVTLYLGGADRDQLDEDGQVGFKAKAFGRAYGPERCPRLAQPLRLDPCPTQIARS